MRNENGGNCGFSIPIDCRCMWETELPTDRRSICFFFVSRSVFFSCWFRPSISLFCGFLPVLSQSTELFQSEPNPHDDRWLIFSSLETIKQPNFYVFFLLAFSPWLVQSLHPSPLPSSLSSFSTIFIFIKFNFQEWIWPIRVFFAAIYSQLGNSHIHRVSIIPIEFELRVWQWKKGQELRLLKLFNKCQTARHDSLT